MLGRKDGELGLEGLTCLYTTGDKLVCPTQLTMSCSPDCHEDHMCLVVAEGCFTLREKNKGVRLLNPEDVPRMF